MDIKMKRGEAIGVKLLRGEKLSSSDFKYLREYCYEQGGGWGNLSEDEIIACDPRTLTPGQKAWRTTLLGYRGVVE